MKRYEVYPSIEEFKNFIKNTGYWLEPLTSSKYSMLVALFDDSNKLIQVARIIKER